MKQTFEKGLGMPGKRENRFSSLTNFVKDKNEESSGGGGNAKFSDADWGDSGKNGKSDGEKKTGLRFDEGGDEKILHYQFDLPSIHDEITLKISNPNEVEDDYLERMINSEHFRNISWDPGFNEMEKNVVGDVLESFSRNRWHKLYQDSEMDFRAKIYNQEDPSQPYDMFFTVTISPVSEDQIDISTKRLGVPGRDLDMDIKANSIDRVRGYAEHSESPEALKKWLRKRYPDAGPRATGETVGEIKTSMDAIIESESGTPEWFEKNYGIIVINDPDEARSRMFYQAAGSLSADPKLYPDMKPYTAEELKDVERTLQSMPDAIMKSLIDVVLLRQEIIHGFNRNSDTGAIERKEDGSYINENPGTLGITYQDVKSGGGNDFHVQTIILPNNAFLLGEHKFMGGTNAEGKNDYRHANIQPIAHEFGHAISYRDNNLRNFIAFANKHGLEPISNYARTSNAEFFAESYATFVGDPEYLKHNRPKLWRWFSYLAAQGYGPHASVSDHWVFD